LHQELPHVAKDSKFPVGCQVWYDARKSRASKVLRAKSGRVVVVYFDFQSMQYIYRVKSSADCERTVYQDRLMFGINCPVTVQNLDTNEEEDGVIVLPKLDVGKDGKQQISYAVQFEKGRHVSVEFLVAADRIKYREVKDNELVGMNDGIEDKKETNITQEDDAEMKASKVDTNLQEKSAASMMNEGGKLPQTPSTSTAAVECKIAVSVGEAGISLGQFATSKATNDSMVRNVAPDEYAKLAHMRVQQNQRTVDGGLQSERDAGIAATATPSTRINQNKEFESSPLDTGRWVPPSPEKTPQGKGGVASSLERKRSFGSEASERPNKMTKTELLTCALTIPKWVHDIKGGKQLFVHLLGVKIDGSTGYKTKRIESMTSCKVSLSNKRHPMKIEITSTLPRNVAQGISMIEESLTEFVSDENSEKKMLYELLSTAEGSFNVKRNDDCRMISRGKEWWALFELPYHKGHGQYHGKFLIHSQSQMPGDCKLELFGDTFGVSLEHASPFVLIRGTKHKDVKDAVSIVRDKMRKHQNRRPGAACNCTPKW